jgi:hypothetical protein
LKLISSGGSISSKARHALNQLIQNNPLQWQKFVAKLNLKRATKTFPPKLIRDILSTTVNTNDLPLGTSFKLRGYINSLKSLVKLAELNGFEASLEFIKVDPKDCNGPIVVFRMKKLEEDSLTQIAIQAGLHASERGGVFGLPIAIKNLIKNGTSVDLMAVLPNICTKSFFDPQTGATKRKVSVLGRENQTQEMDLNRFFGRKDAPHRVKLIQELVKKFLQGRKGLVIDAHGAGTRRIKGNGKITPGGYMFRVGGGLSQKFLSFLIEDLHQSGVPIEAWEEPTRNAFMGCVEVYKGQITAREFYERGSKSGSNTFMAWVGRILKSHCILIEDSVYAESLQNTKNYAQVLITAIENYINFGNV